ncbi:SCO family protein [Peribacillus cavernae]|uniref:SCO family protein n=1 Tax=Peribacillus cavernae TaxID=1674310 RepID=A0A433HW72_9BACI|nr:SCO family protein [Peribacillus cavernae]MDQ0217966.1 protein SCO1/2 [Peribacillus cavernae]RUQ32611.1 SCO family protein [Peribacillus cavernae]
MKKLQQPLAAIFMVCLLLSGCSSKGVPDAKNWDIENFTFNDQEGKPLSKGDLKGHVWVADFIFTNCETVCPPMTANMAKLQKQVKDEGIKDIEFVSFSIDPEVDTPEAMKEYGAKFNADFSNWHFLTGYGQKEIEQFAMDNFKTIVQKPKNEDQVIHGTDFYLIDEEGKIIQYYTGLNKIPIEEIIKHIKILQKY